MSRAAWNAMTVHASVKRMLAAQPDISTETIYESLRATWPGVNQRWLRNTACHYKAMIKRNQAKTKT